MAGVEQTFAQYRIEHELHRGPNAVSYLAVDTILERRVLLKVLQTGHNSTTQVDQFRIEALAYARLQHPNIVTLYQFDTWQGHPFLVLEFVEGESLEQLIRKSGPLPLEMALTISRDLFRGLAYAHDRGVLHRDLKPSNVLVAHDGWTKVADFGLAALVGTGKTRIPGVTGTLAYMAPEVLRGEDSTELSDLYSAGATMYEMLAGRRLFPAEDAKRCAEDVLNARWQPLDTVRSDIPHGVANLVHRLLASNSSERPSSAAAVLDQITELAAELEVPLRAERVGEFLADLPSGTTVTKQSSPSRRASRIKIASVLLGAVLVLAAFTAGLGWLWSHRLHLPGNLRVVTRPAASHPRPNTGELAKPVTQTTESGRSQFRTRRPTRKKQGQREVATAPQPPLSASRRKNLPAEQTSKPETTPDAQLVVRCTPWAEIELDGAAAGVGSRLGRFRLPPGEHSVVLRHPEFPPCTLRVALKPAQCETLIVNLWAKIAQLWLQVAPWAEVWVDEKPVDTTPLDHALILTPGVHTIELRNPAFKAWRKTLRLQAGTKVTLRVSLATGFWELVQ